MCVFRRVRGISRFHDVKPINWGRLDAWDVERYVALVREVEEATLDKAMRTDGGCYLNCEEVP